MRNDMEATGPPGGSRPESARPRVGVSSCLLGVPVRYDGGHRRSRFLLEELGPRVEWVRVCPEVEIGLGTPRPPIDLHETLDPNRPRIFQGTLDLTARMRSYALGRIEELRSRGLDGYVLKARSPSCGLRQVKLVRADGRIERAGRGVFAQALREVWPELPAFDETDLEDPKLASARLEWIFTMHRFRTREPGVPGLAAFHLRHEPMIAARDPKSAGELRMLVDTLAARREREIETGWSDLLAAEGRYARVLSASFAIA